MANPTIRGMSGTANGGLNTINADIPTGTTAPVVGDWMIVVINTTAASPTITGPSGWTQVMAPVAMGSRYMSVWQAVRSSGDSMLMSYMFMQSTTGSAQALLVYGVGVYGSLGAYSKGASASTQTTPGVTTTVANSLALSLQAEATSATETDSQITVASPFTKDLWTIAPSSPINSVLLSHRYMTTAGATGDAVSTWPNPTGNRGSIMAVILPTTDTTTKLAAKMADGNGSVINVGLVGWDGSKEIALSKIEPVYGGIKVPELLSTSRVFTMSHRGGSLDYQEMSMRGYTQSAIAHADALEFSVARTSDGVFFGLHDDTLNRTTSGLAANYKPGEHTWAEISALQQDLSNRGDTRFTTAPYMKLQDLIDVYGKSHTIFIDPKVVGSANFPALITTLKTFSDYKNTFVGKYYHTGTSVATLFTNEGMATWGYSYDGDLDDGSTAATASYWTMLGLTYSSDVAHWNQILSIAGSKKVIGHIVPTVAAADQAVSRGAKGLQVSGINVVSTKY